MENFGHFVTSCWAWTLTLTATSLLLAMCGCGKKKDVKRSDKFVSVGGESNEMGRENPGGNYSQLEDTPKSKDLEKMQKPKSKDSSSTTSKHKPKAPVPQPQPIPEKADEQQPPPRTPVPPLAQEPNDKKVGGQEEPEMKNPQDPDYETLRNLHNDKIFDGNQGAKQEQPQEEQMKNPLDEAYLTLQGLHNEKVFDGPKKGGEVPKEGGVVDPGDPNYDTLGKLKDEEVWNKQGSPKKNPAPVNPLDPNYQTLADVRNDVYDKK